MTFYFEGVHKVGNFTNLTVKGFISALMHKNSQSHKKYFTLLKNIIAHYKHKKNRRELLSPHYCLPSKHGR